jgi:PKD repeat protein
MPCSNFVKNKTSFNQLFMDKVENQMKNKYLIILLIGLVCLVPYGCEKADEADRANVGTLTYPIASFSISGNDGPAPVVVTLTNTSQYSNSYKWTFGDGYSSYKHTPEPHTYYNNTMEPKNYLIVLTAKDTVSGLTNTRSRSILVLPSNK